MTPRHGSKSLAAFGLALLAILFSAGAGLGAEPEFDSKDLLKEFQQAQKAQLKAFAARERSSTSALKAAQTAKQKGFDQHEKEARRKFFAEEHPGAEKRDYMHGLLARRDEFRKELTDERVRAKADSDSRLKALKELQKENLQKFKDSLNQGERPPDSLWPQPSP